MVQVGQTIQGRVVDFASGGEGVLKIGAYPVFVPFAIVGEEVAVRIVYAQKDFAFAEVAEVISRSENRVKPRCPYFGKCGGCSLQHMSYETQLEIKRADVINSLRKFGGIECEVDDTISVNEWEYRNKLALPFGYRNKSKRVVLGFYEKKSHTVVPMKWCPLHGEWCADLIEDVCEWANSNNISVYEENTSRGILRHLVARMLDTLTLTLTVNSHSVPFLDSLVKKLDRHFQNYTIFVSPNCKNSNAVMGEEAILLYGKEKKQNLGKFDAVVSPLSFLQVNNAMRDKIYDDVCSYLADFDGRIVELYSGVGLLTAQIASRLPKANITSVEIVPSAVSNAKALMRSLGCDDRVNCICADATTFVSSLSAAESIDTVTAENAQFRDHPCDDKNLSGKTNNAIILDPPRKGCDLRVLQAVNDGNFDKVIYLSCNPQTLGRDLKILCKNYELLKVTPYDMFAQTSHIETLVCLRTKKS